MRLLRATRWLPWLATLAIGLTVAAAAQADPNDVPLGDVARNLRKNVPPPATLPAIDDDNLPQVMDSVNHGLGLRSRWPFLVVEDSKLHEPDVTCSLSFTVNVKSLISRQYDQMELPQSELAKIDAKAVIEANALTVLVFNGTQWHLSELSVAFTVVKRSRGGFGTFEPATDAFDQIRPEKKPDRTEIFRMRAAGAPWERTVFSTPLDLNLGANDEWHWAIVSVKGYAPEAYISKEGPGSTLSAGHTVVPSAFSTATTTEETVTPIAPPNSQ